MTDSQPMGQATMQVFIAGAGYVGLELARQLTEGGHRAWAARRSVGSLPPDVTPWPCDLRDRALEVPPEASHVAFTAAPGSASDSYEATYVEALERTLEAFARRGRRPARLVFVSSTSVYADPTERGAAVDESSPTLAEGNAAHLLRAEALVQREGGVVLRLAGIYGPGRTRLLKMVQEGSARCARTQPLGNRIHRDDCAGAIAHLLAHPSPEPLYLGVDDAPVPLCEVYRWLAAELGVPPPPLSDGADARGGTHKRCMNTRLLASGYRLRFPTYREGYAPLLAASGVIARSSP